VLGSSEGAPWWGVPVVAGVFLVVGATLGFFFNWLLEGRRARREDQHKWDERLVDHATKALALAVQFEKELPIYRPAMEAKIQEIRELAATSEQPVGFDVGDTYPSYNAMRIETTALKIIAPSGVVAASEQLARVGARVVFKSIPGANVQTAPGAEKDVSDVRTARTALENAIRKHFKI
jgi:hypothetical protein